MNGEQLCLGCMAPKTEEETCPHCGWMHDSGPLSPLHLPPGTILQNKYLIGKSLGQGGFGITYLAWDFNLEIKLAVKEFFPQGMVSRALGETQVSAFTGETGGQYEYGMEKFLAEARTLAKFIKQPGIVTVRDFFQENNTAYMVMNYIEGITLEEYLQKKGGQISFQQTLNIMMPVMDALQQVHEAEILHRDISPDNVFIDIEGRVQLIDFGAARQDLGDKSKSLSVVLKPGYAPEEQYRSKGKQGPWTDLYAVAATIYRAITGVTPTESLDRLNSDQLSFPSTIGVEIPEAAERVLLRALEVSAEDRYQSTEEFQQALQQSLHSPESNIQPTFAPNYSSPGANPVTDSTAVGAGEANYEYSRRDEASTSAGRKHPEGGGAPIKVGKTEAKDMPPEAVKNKSTAPGMKISIAAAALVILLLVGFIIFDQLQGTNEIVDSDDNATFEFGSATENGENDVTEDDPGTEISEATSYELIKRGNTSGNVANAGLAAGDGEWIYYQNAADGNRLYRKRPDGSERKRLNDYNSWYINVKADWVYYRATRGDNYIYRMRKDGSDIQQLSADGSRYLNVADGWIYYSNMDDGDKIYRIRFDGSERQRLNSNGSWYINVAEDWIYYQNKDDNDRIYRIRNDGSNREIFSEDSSRYINLSDGRFYYINQDDGNRVYSIDKEGNDRRRLNNNDSRYINVSQEWIFYINQDDNNNIYRMRKDGSEQQRIAHENAKLINIIEDWVYYKDQADNMNRMRFDGSEQQLVY